MEKVIPDFKTYISESVWGDMRRRAEGQSNRKEDSVNLLDIEGLEQYLQNHYEYTGRFKNHYEPMVSSTRNALLSMNGFAEKDHLGTSYYHLYMRIRDDKKVVSIGKTAQKLHIYELMMKQYIMSDMDGAYEYKLEPKEGNVDNQFFIDVLDFIIANVQSPEENIVKKIEK